MLALKNIIEELIKAKFQADADGDYPIQFALVNRREQIWSVRPRAIDYKPSVPDLLGMALDMQLLARRIERAESAVEIWDCAPGCPVVGVGEQMPGGDDGDMSARYFFQADWNAEAEERIAGAFPVRYEPKASQGEREAEGTRIGPVGIKDDDGNRVVVSRICDHPTVKPISLNRWLASLLLPPAAYAPRRLFVPFAGVASEMIGSYLAGWEKVVGVERDRRYCDLGLARLKHWTREDLET